MAIKIIFVALFLISFEGYGQESATDGQTSYYDSLLLIARNPSESIENRALAFNKVAFRAAYRGSNKEKDYTIEYLRFTEKHQLVDLISSAYHLRGYEFMNHGQLDSAEATYLKGLSGAKNNPNLTWIAELTADLGVLYATKGDYQLSEAYHLESIELANKIPNRKLQARGKINMGELYETQGKYKASLSAFQEALDFCVQAHLTGYLSTIYSFLGDINLKIKEYETAKEQYSLAYTHGKRFKNQKRMALALQKMGALHAELDELGQALKYYDRALSIAEKKDMPLIIGSIKSNIAAVKLRIGKSQEARMHIEEAIELYEKFEIIVNVEDLYLTAATIYDSLRMNSLAKKHYLKCYKSALASTNIVALRESSIALADIYQLEGNPAESVKYYKEYIKYNLVNRDNEAVKEIIRMDLQGDYREKVLADSLTQLQEILQLEQKRESARLRSNIAYIWVSALTLLVLLIGFLFIQKRRSAISLEKKNQEINQALEAKEVLLKEVHHRVKNNMQVVSSLLKMKSRNTEDPTARAVLVESQERIDSMRLIHQQMYKKGNFKQIDAAEYFKDIITFLLLPIKGEKDDFTMENESIWMNVEQAQTLGFIVYELITNSIKHAWEEGDTKNVRISLINENGTFYFRYADNGKGTPEVLDYTKAKSFGMKLIVALATRQLEGKMDIKSDNGYCLTIQFNAR